MLMAKRFSSWHFICKLLKYLLKNVLKKTKSGARNVTFTNFYNSRKSFCQNRIKRELNFLFLVRFWQIGIFYIPCSISKLITLYLPTFLPTYASIIRLSRSSQELLNHRFVFQSLGRKRWSLVSLSTFLMSNCWIS